MIENRTEEVLHKIVVKPDDAFENKLMWIENQLRESMMDIFPEEIVNEVTLYTDACNLGLGAVLSQEDEDKKCRPLAFYSKKLTKSQLKYAIGVKELMAIFFGMEKFKIYLIGPEFIVRTDHRPLQWLKDLSNPSTRLRLLSARWLIIARQFDFKIEFISGNKNVVADALSRYFIYGKKTTKMTIKNQASS